MRKDFTETATKGVLQICAGQLLLKSFKMSVKESDFQSKGMFQEFSSLFKTMATGYFLTYFGQNLAGLCLFTEVRYRISPKKCSENFIEYFTHSKNGMAKYCKI